VRLNLALRSKESTAVYT